MTTSTWKLYKNSKILPDKNFKVDSLEDYLETLTKEEFLKMQHIKHGLSISVDINKTQATLDFFNSANNYNYISIQNVGDDTYPCYYFILRKVWLSNGAIRFILKMDTLNTFTTERGSYSISNKTLVDREHKDRFGLFMVIGSTIDDGFIDNDVIFNKQKILELTGQSHLEFDHNNVTIKWFNNQTHKFVDEYSLVCAEIRTDDGQIKIYGYDNDDNVILKSVINLDQLPDYYYLSWRTNSSYDDFTCAEIEDDIYKLYDEYFTTKIKRTIDMYGEGLTPILLKTGSLKINDKNLGDVNWYLVYKNRDDVEATDFNQVNPVECYVIQDNPINVTYTGGNVIAVKDLEDGHLYYVKWDANVTLTDDQSRTGSTNETSTARYGLYFYKSGNDIVWGETYGNQGDTPQYATLYTEIGRTKYLSSNVNPLIAGKSDSILHVLTPTEWTNETSEVTLTLASSSVQIDGIDDIDRSSAKMIKIIKLPYCPIELTKSGSIYSFDSSKFEYKATDEITGIAFKDLNMSLLRSIETLMLNPYYAIEDLDFTNVSPYDKYQSKFESKLLHSDFYQKKFVYDSFSYTFKLEFADVYNDIPQLFNFKFKMTTTINSKFLYQFDETILSYATEDYERSLPVARNNEMALYNNQYINYLRTGFNYDVKSKNRQEVASVVGTGLQLVGAIASFASAGVTGGMGIATGIGLLTSTTMSAINTANTIAQSEQNIQARMTQARSQATNVSGSDDVDLMSYYAGNRPRMMTYELSPKMKQAMLDVFHYNGYISGEMKVPNTTGRIWFNFVSCDIIFSEVKNIPDDCLEDLKTLFKDGVTYMHKYENEWNWERQYENWEDFIAEEVL